MFRKTSPQRSMFGVEHRMDPVKRARLERTWAHQFRTHALPLIDESRFAKFFDDDNGRPNKSVQLVVSVLVLKEVHDLTDEEALARLEWDTSWHYALDLLPEEAHTCRKTLHNFRTLMLKDGEGAGVFESTTARLIKAASLQTGRQRHDSTHIMSNIRVLTRLGLFVETITRFLVVLRKEHPAQCAHVSEELCGRYLDREGYFGDVRAAEAPRRLRESALDVYWLVKRFSDDAQVAAMESFQLLARLYAEQCVPPPDDDPPEKIDLQEKPSSSSLQSPSDPDVTYGHKGKGYEAQLAETCVEENPFQVVTAASVNGANESDQHQVIPILEQTERTCGAAPELMHTDCGMGSGENIVAARAHGTDLAAPIGAKPSDQGVTRQDFSFDATNNLVQSCPTGEQPVSHQPTRSGNGMLAIFAAAQCLACPLRAVCPTEQRGEVRVLPFTPADIAVAQRRVEQQTPEFKERHKIRSGIEATNSELKRSHRLGKLRVRGRPRVALSVRLKVTALNIKRYVAHLTAVATAAAESLAPTPACGC